MTQSLKHKQVVIIGGSSGFGLRTAELVAEQGADVLIVGRHDDRLAEARESLLQFGTEITTQTLDAHDHEALAQWFAGLQPFDHLVSMIGDVMGGGFLAADMTEIRRVMESKFFTNVRIGQLAASKVKEGGSLVFTSGTGGRAQDACASYIGNLGINALVEGLAVELAPKARVNAVSPTWTVTTFWRDMEPDQKEQIRQHFADSIPMKRTAEVDEISQAYLFLITNGFITGQAIAVDGGIMLGAL